MGVSIVVAASGRCDPGPFLQVLRTDMAVDSDVEVHISHDVAWPSPLSDLPGNVQIWRCPKGTSMFKLWGNGIARSSREYVAILDLSCPPRPGWLQAVRRGVEDEIDLLLGPVVPYWTPEDQRIVGYLVEYAQFYRPLSNALSEVPGINLVFDRRLVDSLPRLQDDGFVKTTMLQETRHQGTIRKRTLDDMVVVYRREFALRAYLARRWRHGRFYAARRFSAPNQPPKLLCVAFTPILGFVRTWRIYRAARKVEDLRRAFFRHLVTIVLVETAWSVGEFVGYTLGDRRR